MPKHNIRFPDENELLDQNEEYFILNEKERIKFHDYNRIYSIPHLYETVFHEHLECKSPEVIKDLLYKHVPDNEIEHLRILDFGAGNGLVAEALSEGNPDVVVGIDILESAKVAVLQERDNIYQDYLVADLAETDEKMFEELKSYRFNALVSVAALGYNHIPPQSFVNAFNLIENGGWVAFNLRDKFLTGNDDSGFKEALEWISADYLELLDEHTYVHRLSTQGEPIHYTAMVAKKMQDIETRE